MTEDLRNRLAGYTYNGFLSDESIRRAREVRLHGSDEEVAALCEELAAEVSKTKELWSKRGL